MAERFGTRVLALCLAVSLVANAWMLMENRRVLSEWAPPEQSTVQVHVLGAVTSPGVYSLPSGARIADALSTAGGTLPNAALGELNLAKPLFDGEQILVAAAQATPASDERQAGAEPSPDDSVRLGLINVNTATAAQLESLPYIGPSKAEAIVAYRQQHGAFARVEDLVKVPGIGEATLAKFKHLVTV